MESNYLYFGIAVLAVIALGLLFSKNLKAIFSEKGLEIEKKEGNDNVIVTKVKNDSDVDINTKEGQNIKIDDIDSSKVKLNKNNENK